MAVLSENNKNDNDIDDGELPDIFLQTEYLSLNNQIKDKIRELLNNNKIELSTKDLQTLIKSLKESYEFEYNLKSRIYSKKTEFKRNERNKATNGNAWNNPVFDLWKEDQEDKRDF
jgi:hypothetical protein